MSPRSSFMALAAFLTIGIFLLRQSPATPSFYHDVFGRSRALSTWLDNEEARYAGVVQARQELIRKWGPTDAEVES